MESAILAQHCLRPSPAGLNANTYKCPCMQLNCEMPFQFQLLVLFIPLGLGMTRASAVCHFDFMTGEGGGW